MQELRIRYNLLPVFKQPLSYGESTFFAMVDSSEFEYHIIMTNNVMGGWVTTRTTTIDSTNVSTVDSNKVIEYISVNDKEDYTDFMFTVIEDLIFEFEPGQELGGCFAYEDEFMDVLILDGALDSSVSDHIERAWQVNENGISPIDCNFFLREDSRLYCSTMGSER